MKNTKGSALVWAIASMMILVVLVLGIFSMSQSHNNKSLAENESRQAYLTARSAVDMVLAHLDGLKVTVANVDEWGNIKEGDISEDVMWEQIAKQTALIPRYANSPVALSDFDFGSEDMGEITEAIITRESDTANKWIISVTAERNERSETVKAVLDLTIKSSDPVTVVRPERESVKVIFQCVYLKKLKMQMGLDETPDKASRLWVKNGDVYLEQGGLNRVSLVISRKRLLKIDNGSFFTSYRMHDPSGTYAGDRVIRVYTFLGAGLDCFYVTSSDSYYGSLSSFGDVFAPNYSLKTSNNGIHFENGKEVEVKNGLSNLTAGTHYRRVNTTTVIDLSAFSAASEVYAFIDSGKTLTLTGTSAGNCKLYLYGPGSSKVIIQGVNGAATINGAIVVGELELPAYNSKYKTDVVINYFVPESSAEFTFDGYGGTQIEVITEGRVEYSWGFSKYE